jgi:hypothetical protein
MSSSRSEVGRVTLAKAKAVSSRSRIVHVKLTTSEAGILGEVPHGKRDGER